MYEYRTILPTEEEYMEVEEWLNNLDESGWEFVACPNEFRISGKNYLRAGWIFRRPKSNKEKK